MPKTFLLVAAAALMFGFAGSVWISPRAAQSQESKAEKVGHEFEKELETAARAFEAAFNKGDATGLAAQFAEKAEVVDEDENVVIGRDNIRNRFAEIFKKFPKARIEIRITSLKLLAPDVALEEGVSATVLEPDAEGSSSPYMAIHLKRNGKWLLTNVRDFPAEEGPKTAHDELASLEWLVGDWVDQTDDAKVETSCRWADDGNYLLQDYVVKLRGGVESRGTQRIGWDPLRKTIRGWAFDHSGGFGESTWTPVDGGWVIKAEGVTPDGKAASATRFLTLLSPDLFELNSTQRLVGDELLPDARVRVARRPPKPAAN